VYERVVCCFYPAGSTCIIDRRDCKLLVIARSVKVDGSGVGGFMVVRFLCGICFGSSEVRCASDRFVKSAAKQEIVRQSAEE